MNIGIKYTIDPIPFTSILFTKTYYVILVTSGVDFGPNPNRYPSDYFSYLLKNIKVSSNQQTNHLSENCSTLHVFYNCDLNK